MTSGSAVDLSVLAGGQAVFLLEGSEKGGMEAKDHALSGEMVRYLCNFAKNGDPNLGEQVAPWTEAQSAGKQVLCMGEEPGRMRKIPMLKLIHTMLTNKAVGE